MHQPQLRHVRVCNVCYVSAVANLFHFSPHTVDHMLFDVMLSAGPMIKGAKALSNMYTPGLLHLKLPAELMQEAAQSDFHKLPDTMPFVDAYNSPRPQALFGDEDASCDSCGRNVHGRPVIRLDIEQSDPYYGNIEVTICKQCALQLFWYQSRMVAAAQRGLQA